MKEKPMKKTSICLGVLGAVSLQGCLSTSEAEKELDYYEQATEIAQETIIVDGHIDVPYRLQEKWVDVNVRPEIRIKSGVLEAKNGLPEFFVE